MYIELLIPTEKSTPILLAKINRHLALRSTVITYKLTFAGMHLNYLHTLDIFLMSLLRRHHELLKAKNEEFEKEYNNVMRLFKWMLAIIPPGF